MQIIDFMQPRDSTLNTEYMPYTSSPPFSISHLAINCHSYNGDLDVAEEQLPAKRQPPARVEPPAQPLPALPTIMAVTVKIPPFMLNSHDEVSFKLQKNGTKIVQIYSTISWYQHGLVWYGSKWIQQCLHY